MDNDINNMITIGMILLNTRKSPRQDVIIKILQDDNLKIMDNSKLIDHIEFEIELRIEGYNG